MRILIIEDDIKLCEAMSFYLEHSGYLADMCNRGDEGLLFASKNSYDLIILDRLLPYMNGLNILRSLRNEKISTPIIMVTALNELNDRIDGFDKGADDYLGKPFAMEELGARIKALLRRPTVIKDNSLLKFSNIMLDVVQKLLISDCSKCELSKKEASLMEILISNSEQTLPRDLILFKVWGPDSYVYDSNIDTFIFFLRRKLKSVHAECKITTIHSIGYRLER